MATTPTDPDGSSGPLTHLALPLLLLLALLGGVVGGAYWFSSTYVTSSALAAASSEAHEQTFVLRRLTDPLHLNGRDSLWLLVLLPVLALGLFYVGLLYARDSRTVGWAWAAFLGTLRAVVYLLLATVFLLPAQQTWDRIESSSRVALLFDVSGSMLTVKDDLVTPTMTLDKLQTRQEKVLQLLADEKQAFVPRLLEKNPLNVWRFGGVLDKDVQLVTAANPWGFEQWTSFLKPDPKAAIPASLNAVDQARFAELDENGRLKFTNDRLGLYQQLVSGSNLGGALEEVFNAESNRSPLKQVQGVVVISDGRSNQGSAQSFEEIAELTRKSRVPVFVVAVGQDREQSRVTITVLQAPGQTRGDDRFPVRVEVDGEGLANQEFKVFLDVTKGKSDGKGAGDDLALVEVNGSGEPTGTRIVLGKKVTLTPEKDLRFAPGKPPHAKVEIPVDPETLAKAAGKSLQGPASRYELEGGDWQFQARVPRDAREIFETAEHLSDPAAVTVIKRPLRVLLFAEVPTHEFQFLRTILVREVDRKRAELSICLQQARPGIVQDVPEDRLLKRFPHLLLDENDPQVPAAEKYYNLGQYDLIIAFDPDWTRFGPEEAFKLEQWVDKQGGGLIVVGGSINTVELTRKDNRDRLKPILDLYPVILGDIRDLSRKADKPWPLHFPGATAEQDYLKLDEEGKSPRAGWAEFFTPPADDGAKESDYRRGFYSYYPVEGRKPAATVIATFSDPDARLPDQQEQPYFVTMRYGSGRTFWIGSGETWRLREYRSVFHERFWTKLARAIAAANDKKKSRRGFLNVSRTFFANKPIEVEAKLYARDLEAPLPETSKPEIRLIPPPGAPASAVPAKLEMRPKLPGAADGWFIARFDLKTPGEYALDLVIPDTGDLLQGKFLVKESLPEELENVRPDFAQLYQLASRVSDLTDRLKDKPDLREKLRQLPQPESAKAEEAHLYFDLKSAELIPECLTQVKEVKPSRGGFRDLWDQETTANIDRVPFVPPTEVHLSWVMLLIVGLLSAEWLARKMLRLA